MVAATSHGSAARPNASPADSRSSSSARAGLLQELVPGDARRDRVDPHPVLDGFDCAATGQRHHAGLGRRVVRLRVLRAPAQHAGVVDDDPAVAGVAEVPQRRAGGPHHRRQRHVQDAVPLVVGHVDHRRLPAQAGVVHQHVQPAQPCGRRGDQRVDLRGGCDVARPRSRPGRARARQLVAGLAEPAFVVVGDDDVGTLGQRTTRRRRTDAGAGRGGHDDDLAVQKPVSGNLFRRDRQIVTLDLPG